VTLPFPWPSQRIEQQPTHPRLLSSHVILVGMVTDVIMDSILNFDNIFASKFILGDAINFVQTCNYHNCLCIMYFVLSVMNYNKLVFLDEYRLVTQKFMT